MKYLVIDRNNGCRPAKNADGSVKTVEAVCYIDALAKANPEFQGDNLDLAPFNVMEQGYLRQALTGKAVAS
jgi:hypothetical protein